ncbi:MAG: 2OG-Fe(II) oxygenase [Pseudomarimonas sp.]
MTEATRDFIELVHGAIDPRTCVALIQRFDASNKASRGRTGSGVDLSMKDSWDICIDDHPEWRDAVNLLNTAMMAALMRYVRCYPHTVLAPLALRSVDPASGKQVTLDTSALLALPDDLLQALLVKVFRPGSINLQKYIADQGGYPYWHCEHYPKLGDSNGETLHRVLLWSVYLNDEFAAGETEFHHQQRRIVPATGALLMAPAAFTHSHRGNRPLGGNKYIATSWVLFQRAESLFAAAPATGT